MGRRGPLPAPAQVKRAKGETRPSQVNYEEPLPRQRAPEMPQDMDPLAQAVWVRVLEEMEPTGVIVRADTDILRAFCEASAMYVQAVRTLQASGPIIRGARGNDLVVNPMHRIVREEREAMRLLSRDLGLSPAARAALRVDLNANPGDLDEVLGAHPRLRALPATG